MTEDPIAKFLDWLEQAKQCAAIPEPTAMNLATVNASGHPSSRIVLLKEVTAQGFVFYTNNESAKGEEISANRHVALCFYWGQLNRQVRVRGIAEKVSNTEADMYFASRVRESQVGAWASKQSRPLESREQLLARFEEEKARLAGKSVPRPPYWSGWRVVPQAIEFWQLGEHRLHDRDLFSSNKAGWTVEKLYP